MRNAIKPDWSLRPGAAKFQAAIAGYLAAVQPFVKEQKWPAFRREVFEILCWCMHHRLLRHGVPVSCIQNNLGAHRKRWQYSIRTDLQTLLRLHERWNLLVWNTLHPPTKIPAEYQVVVLIRWRGVVDDDLRVRCWRYFRESRRGEHYDRDALAVEIDHPIAWKRYCKFRRPGWGYLRLVDPGILRSAAKNITPYMQDAILSDSISQFEIMRSLAAERVSRNLFTGILKAHAPQIMAYVLQSIFCRKREFLQDRILFCVSGNRRVPEETACVVIRTLEEIAPGTIESAVDPFGNTLLWYAASFRGAAPDSLLIQTLLACGADPHRRNHLNLSYALITEHVEEP